jgi:ribosomal biogenesis protein LAS1
MLSVPKKQITRILKSVIQLYSSFSSEIVSVLLDYLLKTLSSSEFKKNVDDASVGPTIENVLADWKPVILKLCNKKPELLLNLLKEVLHKIEAQEDMKCEEGTQQFCPQHSC